MRCFIAVDIPPFAKDVLAEIQKGFDDLVLDVKWVRPANIHLTLKFFAAVDEPQLEKVRTGTSEIAGKYSQFIIRIRKTGVYPSFSRPRVIWTGIEASDSSLSAIRESLECGLESLGFPRERRDFTPHLTLGRFRSGKGKKPLQERMKSMAQTHCEPIHVHSLTLYKSQLTPQGSIYTVLEKFPLHPAEA